MLCPEAPGPGRIDLEATGLRVLEEDSAIRIGRKPTDPACIDLESVAWLTIRYGDGGRAAPEVESFDGESAQRSVGDFDSGLFVEFGTGNVVVRIRRDV